MIGEIESLHRQCLKFESLTAADQQARESTGRRTKAGTT